MLTRNPSACRGERTAPTATYAVLRSACDRKECRRDNYCPRLPMGGMTRQLVYGLLLRFLMSREKTG